METKATSYPAWIINLQFFRIASVMLCYVMLCYVMLCYVMLCYVMLCYVMLCYVMFWYDFEQRQTLNCAKLQYSFET